MKILHITQLLGIGGLERVLFILIQEQMKAGHQVALLVYGTDQTWVETFREQGITVITEFQQRPGYDLALVRYLWQLTNHYQLIHTHDLNPAMYLAPLQLAYRLGLRRSPHWIHTTHGLDHLKQRPITIWYERICATLCDGIVGVSGHVCDTYIHRLGIRANKVHQIDNGTPLAPRQSLSREEKKQRIFERLGLTLTTPMWLCVSRVVPLKDQKLLLLAAQARPEMQLILVGPSGNDSYWQELKALCPPNAHLVGGQSAIDDLLACADFFVSASHHEGIPVAVLEAGAMEIPCLLSDIPGHRALQVPDTLPVARFFPVADLPALAEAMSELEQQPLVCQQRAQRLKQLIAERFSAERMYERYWQLYQGVA